MTENNSLVYFSPVHTLEKLKRCGFEYGEVFVHELFDNVYCDYMTMTVYNELGLLNLDNSDSVSQDYDKLNDEDVFSSFS